jgi:putative glutathione S-transferase
MANSEFYKTNPSAEKPQNNILQRKADGEFIRGVSKFRSRLGAIPEFPAEPGRYHLFVSFNCPWCHRVTLARNILGLEKSITMDVAFPNRTGEDDTVAAGLWEFNPARLATLTGDTLPECTKETGTKEGYRLIKQIYEAEGSDETSVPILYDKKSKRIISNESSEIVRMLNQEASQLGSSLSDKVRPDLYPSGDDKAQLRAEIEALNDQIYDNINDGAYKAGFSSNQEVYARAFSNYFDTLAVLEKQLVSNGKLFLTGNTFTEADLRLFPTLFRHDPVYFVRMKLNGARILDFPKLWRWLCRVYAMPGVAESNSLIHCRQGYFGRSWNNVVALGPLYPMSYPEAYKHPELVDHLT